MRQAITTKYLGPTNYRGGRIVARATAGRLVMDWRHDLGIEENHRFAARRLAYKLGWDGAWAGGGLPDDRGYCFVLAESEGFVANAQ